MRSAVTRLIRSSSPVVSPSRLSAAILLKKNNSKAFLSEDASKRVEEPFKVEEAETVKVPPPSPDKLLVLGGNGFVGSHVCKEALDKGFTVASLNRSGKPSISESWADKVIWNQGNLLEPDSLKDIMEGFGSNSYMYKINGTANINAIRVAADKGIKRFVYVSAADFGFVNYLLQGYYEGKRATEAELLSKFTYGGVILRPGFIHGTRHVGSVKVPLGLVGSPMQMVLQSAKPLTRLPLVGPLLIPPVSVASVAKVAVRAATDPVFPPGIVDVYGIMRYSDQK
uniref:NAD(P)-binding domain-containing protein n=1 Tax=Oryza punctata TaxID=4537 RepID=A0A0E0K142_ORYPU